MRWLAIALLTIILISGCSEKGNVYRGESGHIKGVYDLIYTTTLKMGVCSILRLNVSGKPNSLILELKSPTGFLSRARISNESMLDGFEVVDLKMCECGMDPPKGVYHLTLKDLRGSVISESLLEFEGAKLKIVDVRVKGGKLYVDVLNDGDVPAIVDRVVVVNGGTNTFWFMEGIDSKGKKTLEFSGVSKLPNKVFLYSRSGYVAEFKR